jgi:multidrug efflux pump subunit AcrA (membrane-fusion protein)
MRHLKIGVFWAAVVIAVGFSVYSFIEVSATAPAAEPPLLEDAPARVYGFIEPAGREVYVCPPLTRRVTAIWVTEGDMVEKGQKLCTLENSVELRDIDLARARVEAARKNLEISRDLRDRKAELYGDRATSELEYTQARLKAELDSVNLLVAGEELRRAVTVADQLELNAPVDGVVYRFDVRLGETLVVGEGARECPIMLGSTDLWVRLYVESFWADRIAEGAQYEIYSSETGEKIGTAKVLFSAPYLGRRGFRTEDVNERFDTGYREVVLSLEPVKATIPIGLSVVADLAE